MWRVTPELDRTGDSAQAGQARGGLLTKEGKLGEYVEEELLDTSRMSRSHLQINRGEEHLDWGLG